MTFPSFSAGETLRAVDMNAVGLWLVKSQTIGTTAASVPVTDAFSSSYDSYLIQVSGGVGSVTSILNLQLGAKNTNYSYQFLYGNWGNTPLALGTTTGTSFNFAGSYDANGISMNCVVINPNLAKATRVIADSTSSATFSGNMTGYDGTTTQYTGFTLIPASGTLTGGTINVYGFKK
jgi:hypothetical protein